MESENKPAAQWQPLPPVDRRVLGVLVEKAKTTPAGYPMTVNAVCTGSNQKSNRAPVMELTPDDVQESLDRLRPLGAVVEIQGDGRAMKYRHLLYQWLGVDKVELAVMAELLLRGPQTVGELRGRAARMEPIADLAALHPVLESLQTKKLVISLTPAGRGQVVTHNLYPPRELERIRTELAGRPVAPSSATDAAPAASPHATASIIDEVAQLRKEVETLRAEVESLKQQRSVEMN